MIKRSEFGKENADSKKSNMIKINFPYDPEFHIKGIDNPVLSKEQEYYQMRIHQRKEHLKAYGRFFRI